MAIDNEISQFIVASIKDALACSASYSKALARRVAALERRASGLMEIESPTTLHVILAGLQRSLDTMQDKISLTPEQVDAWSERLEQFEALLKAHVTTDDIHDIERRMQVHADASSATLAVASELRAQAFARMDDVERRIFDLEDAHGTRDNAKEGE